MQYTSLEIMVVRNGSPERHSRLASLQAMRKELIWKNSLQHGQPLAQKQQYRQEKKPREEHNFRHDEERRQSIWNDHPTGTNNKRPELDTMNTVEVGNNKASILAPEQSPDQYYFLKNYCAKETLAVNETYTLSSREGDRYYFPLVLHHVKEAISSRNVRTVHEHNGTSFREACRRKNLLIDDTEWNNALQEQFRLYFALLTDLSAALFVLCIHSDQRDSFYEKRDTILQDFSDWTKNVSLACFGLIEAFNHTRY